MAFQEREDDAGSSPGSLLKHARHKRLIAARTRVLAAHIDNEIDELAVIVRAEELEREAAQFEARAANLPGRRNLQGAWGAAALGGSARLTDGTAPVISSASAGFPFTIGRRL